MAAQTTSRQAGVTTPAAWHHLRQVSPTSSAGGTTPAGVTFTFVTTTAPPGSHPLVLRAIDFDAGMVEIANTGSEAFDLTGHWLCNRPNYRATPAETIAPGASLMVSLDGLQYRGLRRRAWAL